MISVTSSTLHVLTLHIRITSCHVSCKILQHLKESDRLSRTQWCNACGSTDRPYRLSRMGESKHRFLWWTRNNLYPSTYVLVMFSLELLTSVADAHIMRFIRGINVTMDRHGVTGVVGVTHPYPCLRYKLGSLIYGGTSRLLLVRMTCSGKKLLPEYRRKNYF